MVKPETTLFYAKCVLTDGDQFSGSKLRRSIVRLNKLDYFSEVDIEPVPTGDPGEMDLKVKVKDKNTGMVSGGIGYSTSDSVFVSCKDYRAQPFWSRYGIRS